MPYRPERQYRSFAASNFKPIIEKRSSDDGQQEQSYKVKGYWTVFSTEYELYPRTKYWPAQYEQIDPHALDEADLSDVIFQENHEGSPLARIRNNSLEVGVDEYGAWCIADLGGCQRGRELYESICSGLIDEMSFGFIIDSTDESDGYTSLKDDEGDYHTTITRIAKVYDCSAVTFGANPTTDIEEMRKRSYLAAQIEADRMMVEQSDDPETRSAESEDIADGTLIVGEAVEFSPDVESIAQRVAEILDIQYRKDDPRDDDPDDDPEDDPDDENDPDDDDVKERAIVEETFKRRQRRMRAMRLATI